MCIYTYIYTYSIYKGHIYSLHEEKDPIFEGGSYTNRHFVFSRIFVWVISTQSLCHWACTSIHLIVWKFFRTSTAWDPVWIPKHYSMHHGNPELPHLRYDQQNVIGRHFPWQIPVKQKTSMAPAMTANNQTHHHPGRRRRQHHVTNTTNNKQTNKQTNKQKWNTKIKEEVISFGPRGRGIGGQIDPQNPNGSDCGKTSQTNPSAENKSNTIEECWRYSKYTQLTMDKKKPRVI